MWEQVKEFFSGLTDYDRWPPRWHCGYWSDFHGWMYIISDLMIWLSYFLIPLVILRYALRRKNLRFYKVYLLFASFILLCGATHFIDALMFWVPMYRVSALVRLFTGVVSMATVYYLIKMLPQIARLKTTTELEAEIQQRQKAEARLASVNKKLTEANKGLEAFAYVASHDLQEPLRKIRTFGSFMRERSQLDETGNQYLDKIQEASERMSRLIEDVLSLSSLRSDIEMTIIDPNKPIQNALNDLELKIAEKKAVINVQPLPKVNGNEGYLTQLFVNLVNNALKFNNQPPVINIYGEQKDAMVLIHVADNGIGMKEEDLTLIFGAFNRLHPKQLYEGTGIGLAICKKIVEIHSGDITVKSRPGEGTIFTISLPWAFAGEWYR